jgi:hypothetical protein
MIMKYMADRSKFGRKVKKVNKKPEVMTPKVYYDMFARRDLTTEGFVII